MARAAQRYPCGFLIRNTRFMPLWVGNAGGRLRRNKFSIKPGLVFGTAGSTTKRRVPHPPGFLLSLLGSANFMRLSLEKGAHAVLSSAAWQESGVLCALGKGWDTRRSVSRFVVSHEGNF